MEGKDKIYKVGRVYKITSPHTDKVYIGSTVQTLEDRFSKHKYKFQKFKAGNCRYVTVFEILEKGDATIELVKEYENITEKKLRLKEGKKIKNSENSCNKQIPGRTDAEYYCDTIEHRKQYLHDNRQTISEKKKLYREGNKEKINKQKREKHTCEICGGSYTHDHKSTHLKTKKHMACV